MGDFIKRIMEITRVRHDSKRGTLLVHNETPSPSGNFHVANEEGGVRIEYHTNRHRWGVHLTEAELAAVVSLRSKSGGKANTQ